MAKKEEEFEIEDFKVCEKCGSPLEEEDGVLFCPKCDGEIDFFGDDDDK